MTALFQLFLLTYITFWIIMKKQFLCCVLCKQHLLQSTPLKSTQLCKLKCFFTWGKHVQQDWVTWLKVVDVGLRTRCLIQNASGFPVTVGVPRRVQAAGILWLVWCSPRTSRASSFKSSYSRLGGILILKTGCFRILSLAALGYLPCWVRSWHSFEVS